MSPQTGRAMILDRALRLVTLLGDGREVITWREVALTLGVGCRAAYRWLHTAEGVGLVRRVPCRAKQYPNQQFEWRVERHDG